MYLSAQESDMSKTTWAAVCKCLHYSRSTSKDYAHGPRTWTMSHGLRKDLGSIWRRSDYLPFCHTFTLLFKTYIESGIGILYNSNIWLSIYSNSKINFSYKHSTCKGSLSGFKATYLCVSGHKSSDPKLHLTHVIVAYSSPLYVFIYSFW